MIAESIGQYLIDNVYQSRSKTTYSTLSGRPTVVRQSVRLTTNDHPTLWLYYHAEHGLTKVWDYVEEVEVPTAEWTRLQLPLRHPRGEHLLRIPLGHWGAATTLSVHLSPR
ncbi:MAG: hypothetical protein ACKPKO_03275, partial [Candidatus Fonsibacter sp.]